MHNKYYYLVASLPSLFFGEEAPIDRKRFLEESSRWLAPDDFRCLRSLVAGSPHGSRNSFLTGWDDFGLSLRKEIGVLRRSKKKGEKGHAGHEAGEIFSQLDPLSREVAFEKFRWSFLDERETGYHFEAERIYIYGLKLSILERLQCFDKEKGKKKFEEVCGEMHEREKG